MMSSMRVVGSVLGGAGLAGSGKIQGPWVVPGGGGGLFCQPGKPCGSVLPNPAFVMSLRKWQPRASGGLQQV